MGHLKDIDACLRRADKLLEMAEEAQRNGWSTSYEFYMSCIPPLIKAVNACIRCAELKKKSNGPSIEFKCVGGCLRIHEPKKVNPKKWFGWPWFEKTAEGAK